MEKRNYDLEDRLIDFAVLFSIIVEKLPDTKLANHMGSQGTRSSTAPALLYGEAQSAESQKDFIHKIKILLKELRETKICLKILLKKGFNDQMSLNEALRENEELIAIFAKSVKTAESKLITKQ
ncbi:MAG: four helix bundle protein [Marinilabiliales bacterium]|nr:four helix bundle protein [Marinilabiliales bacterium]